ncbi:MAG: hypothetical protein AAFY76_21410 [Cyanobacteria bacterium J06649_11]
MDACTLPELVREEGSSTEERSPATEHVPRGIATADDAFHDHHFHSLDGFRAGYQVEEEKGRSLIRIGCDYSG